ncbi:hypothetical protein E2C01_042139 [Portunus trituberculatus]|uniref:Uncharacterized protein n=1 Tax=Portunus trituberculatus TaxID=210409 RepID=A0A5B7FSL6_PORTR|nr:hypothetical protein [Portunus trituberculatus]
MPLKRIDTIIPAASLCTVLAAPRHPLLFSWRWAESSLTVLQGKQYGLAPSGADVVFTSSLRFCAVVTSTITHVSHPDWAASKGVAMEVDDFPAQEAALDTEETSADFQTIAGGGGPNDTAFLTAPD